ncbi:hypothetical protein L208DRAFT_1280521, partial [Tricholoma matsutake]
SNIIDLYTVGHEKQKAENRKDVQPFMHNVKLWGPKGEIVQVWGMFDEGAMVAAMCSRVFSKGKHWLGECKGSTRRLHMADGTVMRAEAVWTGTIQVDNVCVEGSFEVFDSGGSWSFLFGKPLMKAFNAVHYYLKDEVTVAGEG